MHTYIQVEMGIRVLTNAKAQKRKSSIAANFNCNQDDWTLMDKMREVSYMCVCVCVCECVNICVCVCVWTLVCMYVCKVVYCCELQLQSG